MSTPRRKRAHQPLDSIDVDTFKSWLQGVEDMQEPDWCPSLEQWRKIRQKIELLEVTEAEPPIPQHHNPVYYPPGVRTPVGESGLAPTRPPLIPAPPPTSLNTIPGDNNVGQDGQFHSSFS